MDLDLYAYKDYRTDPKTKRRVWRGTWFYLIVLPPEPHGRRPQLKRRGFATKGAALDAGREVVAGMRAGQAAPTAVVVPPPATAAVTAAGTPERASLTVEEYLEGWLAAIRVTVDGTTWKNYRTVLRSYVIPWIGHRQLSWLSDDDLSAHYGDLLARGGHRRCVKKDSRCEQAECDNGRPLSKTTVRLVHRVLHKALYDGYKILPVNPAEHARVPKKVSRIMTTWTEEELNRFLMAMVNDRLFAAWYIALTAGLRRGELAGLRWTNVRLDHGFISVVTQRTIDTDGDIAEKDPKGSSLGPVAIGPAAVTVLRTHRHWQQKEAEKAGEFWQPSDYVFVQENGEPYNPPALLRRFKRLCGLANVPVIRLHDARHTCATIALMAGEHPKIVQERLRHASYQTTMDLYSHVSPTMQAGAARRIENIANGGTGAKEALAKDKTKARPACTSRELRKRDRLPSHRRSNS